MFWMVYVDGKHSPTFKHASEESARREAERLAYLSRGAKVYVLLATAACEYKPYQWNNLTPDAYETYDTNPLPY